MTTLMTSTESGWSEHRHLHRRSVAVFEDLPVIVLQILPLCCHSLDGKGVDEEERGGRGGRGVELRCCLTPVQVDATHSFTLLRFRCRRPTPLLPLPFPFPLLLLVRHPRTTPSAVTAALCRPSPCCWLVMIIILSVVPCLSLSVLRPPPPPLGIHRVG